MYEDLNRLEAYSHIPRLPYVQPAYFPFAQTAAPWQTYYTSSLIPPGITTLDTYVAPDPNLSTSYYAQSASAGNGLVFAGNAPTTGVYTGIQEE